MTTYLQCLQLSSSKATFSELLLKQPFSRRVVISAKSVSLLLFLSTFSYLDYIIIYDYLFVKIFIASTITVLLIHLCSGITSYSCCSKCCCKKCNSKYHFYSNAYLYVFHKFAIATYILNCFYCIYIPIRWKKFRKS